MDKVLTNKWFLAKLATKLEGQLLVIVGAMSLLFPFTDLINHLFGEQSEWGRLFLAVIVLAVIWVMCFIVQTVYFLTKNRHVLLELNGGHHVYVQYGDVFSDEAVLDSKKHRKIIIPVNRCFDTEVNENLVSSTTIHGQALKKLYESKQYTKDSLNSYIQEELLKRQIEYVEIDKPQGKKKRYPAGTVVEIPITEGITYAFLALTEFDKKLCASVSDEDYTLAMTRLLEFCDEKSQQFPVVMPLIGGGLSRTRRSEREILEYIVVLIKFSKRLVRGDVHIVVRASGKDKIAIADL